MHSVWFTRDKRVDQGSLLAKAGQGLVEFALVLPILLMLMLGLIEFGRLIFIYGATLASSQEAARYGAAAGRAENGLPHYADCNGIRSTAKRIGAWAGVRDENVAIEYDDGTTTFVSSCSVLDDPSLIKLSHRIKVSVTTYYQPLLPLIPLPEFPIQAETARTIIKDVQIRGTPNPTPTPTQTPTPTSTLSS